MAQQPAVIIIARHGPRLDVAERNWHLTTPTPYDPPLTYGGWKNSTALGTRIASLLYAREQSLSSLATTTEPPTPAGVKSHDFASQHNNDEQIHSRKRKRRTHKVVIHTSPFLRCVQTSVAIAAGISQFSPPAPIGNAPRSTTSSRARTPNHVSSLSARSSVSDYGSATGLLVVPESRHGLVQEVTRRVANEHKRVKLRVDAFLGEWLNPEYFEDITPPPPSAMMVATAKAELMQNDTIDVFTPSITHKSSRSSLWGGASTSGTRPQSRDSALEDWDDIHDALPSPRRDRINSYSSAESSDSAGSRILPYRFGHAPQSILRAETTAYAPPVPTYAISTSDRIPKGYVAHAKNNCTNIDLHWDSSRETQDWGDGGSYGEEWSLMQRRFRRGLNQMIQWYSQHNADDRGEDALGLDQAEYHEEELEEQEDLVVIIVTHGAGCNALIGALTGQPVLLDVGTASLTMGVRKDGAPKAADSPDSTAYTNGENGRRGSLDAGLPSMYDLKIIASSEHLRPGYDPSRFLSPLATRLVEAQSRPGPARGDSMPSVTAIAPWPTNEDHAGRGSMSTALGSIRRPHSSSSTPNITNSPTSAPHTLLTPELQDSISLPDSGITTPSSFTGLWTPPAARTPQLQAKYIKDERRDIFSSLNEGAVSRPTTAVPETGSLQRPARKQEETKTDDTSRQTDADKAEAVAHLRSQLKDHRSAPSNKALRPRVLWAASIDDHPVRVAREGQKRRWTMVPED